MPEFLTTEQHLERFRSVHGNTYDYSQARFISNRAKIVIVCPVHGEFEQSPVVHYHHRCGCPQCGREKSAPKTHAKLRLTQDEFLAAARKLHGDRYDYGKAQYVNRKTKMVITCREHGDFEQLASYHLRGSGCPKCARPWLLGEDRRLAEYQSKSDAVHGPGTYKVLGFVSKKVHPSSHAVMRLRLQCGEHGEFEQGAQQHFNGNRCPQCARISTTTSLSYDTEEFIAKACSIHGSRYDYGPVAYQHSRTPVLIVCREHGPFSQRPSSHLQGHGCPACGAAQRASYSASGPETELADWLSQYAEVQQGVTDIVPPYEIDCWLPEHRFGVEFHGLYYHSERFKGRQYHQRKWQLAHGSGHRLFQLFSDEWDTRRELVQSMLLSRLGLSARRLDARKCKLVELDRSRAAPFLEDSHLQGACFSSSYFGLELDGELVAVMSATSHRGYVELMRFAVARNTALRGGFQRLLTHLHRQADLPIRTFANLRYSTGQAYLKAGFIESGITVPGYFYTDGLVRMSRQRFQTSKLHKRGLVGTEKEMTAQLRLLRVWDAGHLRLVLPDSQGLLGTAHDAAPQESDMLTPDALDAEPIKAIHCPVHGAVERPVAKFAAGTSCPRCARARISAK